ncbi:MAG: ATP-binding protein [Bacteroidia bacterium]|nr:ATP-binding protein [Bacteroidia bacterium]
MSDRWYTRFYEAMTGSLLQPGKVLVLYGPRRVGKTELIRAMISTFKGKIYSGTGDNQELRSLLESQQLTKISALLGGYDLIFIDEAQRIPQIGYGLKLLVDSHPNISIIVTGSSSLDLSNKLGEPLTGRNKVRILYPISVMELNQQFGGMAVTQMLEQLLLFGSYPDVLNAKSKEDKVEYLLSIRDSYLLKDLLEIENIRNPSKLSELLKLLAFQIGHEVSLNELSSNLGIAKQSVERYLDLLEKTFIIKRVGGFSRNLRSEITKTARYYFYDNGIRNALINNFNLIDQRDDIGMLWENFLFIERIKKQEYKRLFSNNYFWRTYNRQEIDLVEERDGKLYGYEFKWKQRKITAPKIWKETYKDSDFEVISKDNFLEFLI